MSRTDFECCATCGDEFCGGGCRYQSADALAVIRRRSDLFVPLDRSTPLRRAASREAVKP